MNTFRPLIHGPRRQRIASLAEHSFSLASSHETNLLIGKGPARNAINNWVKSFDEGFMLF